MTGTDKITVRHRYHLWGDRAQTREQVRRRVISGAAARSRNCAAHKPSLPRLKFMDQTEPGEKNR